MKKMSALLLASDIIHVCVDLTIKPSPTVFIEVHLSTD